MSIQSASSEGLSCCYKRDGADETKANLTMWSDQSVAPSPREIITPFRPKNDKASVY